MSSFIQPGVTDLTFPLAPAPPDCDVDPYQVHTFYFGFTIGSEAIGAYLYARGQPGIGCAQGGVIIYQGLDNAIGLDALYHDYQATLPWPNVTPNGLSLANGYSIEFLEPGAAAGLRYTSPDGNTSFDIEQRAVTPLFGRGHIVPGEEDHHGSADGPQPGGSEQIMHVTGELVIGGRTVEIDCHHVRDRSWNQIRREDPGGAKPAPPYAWTPMHFGDDLTFSAATFEARDTNPGWAGICDAPDDLNPVGHGWLLRNGEVRGVSSVRRDVHDYHPLHQSAVKQTLHVVDSAGEEYDFVGEAVAVLPVPAWPNVAFRDSVHKWTNVADGRVTFCTYQEVFSDTYVKGMRARARQLGR